MPPSPQSRPRVGRGYRSQRRGESPEETPQAFSSVFSFAGGYDQEAIQALAKSRDTTEEPAKVLADDKTFLRPEEDPTYSQTATFVDHLDKYPETVRFGPVQYAFFELPQELEALNKFRAEGFPASAPRIQVLVEEAPKWNPKTNTYQLLLRYRKVFYRKIL